MMDSQAITFLAGFLAILFAYIFLIRWVAARLNDRIDAHRFARIERFLIGGIVLGVVAMFQPWFFVGYRYGFLLLLFSTLGFILWSHVTPAAPQYDESLE
jgi:hypothetical protein